MKKGIFQCGLYGLALCLCSLVWADVDDSVNKIAAAHTDKAEKIEQFIQRELEALEHEALRNNHPVLLKDYGVPIRNPFSQLPANTVAAFAKQGINMQAMANYEARYVVGKLTGSSAMILINTDPHTVLVIGSGTTTHQAIYSRGPVVVLGKTWLMAPIYSKNLLWYAQRAASAHDNPSIGLPVVRSDAQYPLGNPYSVAEEIKAMQALGGQKHGRIRLVTIAKSAENPFKQLPDDIKSKLDTQGIDSNKLATYTAQTWDPKADFGVGELINDDPETVLLIPDDFFTPNVYSLGPVVSYSSSNTDELLSESLIWLANEKITETDLENLGDIRGNPLIILPIKQAEVEL